MNRKRAKSSATKMRIDFLAKITSSTRLPRNVREIREVVGTEYRAHACESHLSSVVWGHRAGEIARPSRDRVDAMWFQPALAFALAVMSR